MMMRQSLRAERTSRLVGAVSLALIAGALGFQYLGHLAPCEMCHWQRWPHIAAAVIGLVLAALWKTEARMLAWLCVALIAISGGIAPYQTGKHWGT